MSAMLDARGWKALFKAGHGTFSEPLLFWVLDDDGPVGYVLNERTGRPRSAERATNFDGYEQNEEADAITIPAESGWWIVERGRNEPEHAYWTKVLAWRIFNAGFGVKAIGAPFPTGESTIVEVEDGKTQFVFDLERTVTGDGPWPQPAIEMAS